MYRKSIKKNSLNPSYFKKYMMIRSKPRTRLNRVLEEKFVDKDTNTSVSTSGSVIPINGIAQGFTSIQRIGVRVCMTSISGRFFPYVSSGNAFMRVLVVYDKRSNGTLPTIGMILDGTPDYSSPLSDTYKYRFTVLYDNLFVLTSSGSMAASDRFYKKIDLPMEFIGTTNLSSVIGCGVVWLVCISSASSTLYYGTRITYKDF